MDRLGALRFGEWAAALPGDTRGTLMRRTWECKPSRYAPPRFRRALAPLARAQARLESGGKVGSTVAEILANIGAMEFAIAHATGVVRTDQNGIGGNNYNPCGASFVNLTDLLITGRDAVPRGVERLAGTKDE